MSARLSVRGHLGLTSHRYTHAMSEHRLTHLDPLGRARMVDVTPKDPTHRRALARGRVYMQPETASLVARGRSARATCCRWHGWPGIQAAKRAPDLIPLCHPLLIGSVLVNFRIEDDYIEVEAQVDTFDRTGVEMEAMTACTVAALTIYDMCKSVDRSMVIGDVTLWEKTGRPLRHLPPRARPRPRRSDVTGRPTQSVVTTGQRTVTVVVARVAGS
jgi:cyclic pyranopterin monophosphate synthase